MLCASGLHNIGTDLILNLIVGESPRPDRARRDRRQRRTAPKPAEDRLERPASAYVFKTTADPFAGRITYFKVYTGVVKNDANLQNVTHGSAERLAHIGVPVGKTLQPVTELHAGDIGAVAKLKDTLTGDTLAEKASPSPTRR